MDGRRGTWGWRGIWQVPLVTVSIFAFPVLGASPAIPVSLEPPFPLEGQEATLTPGGGSLGNVIFCSWFRGPKAEPAQQIATYYLFLHFGQVNGPSFTGREAVDAKCSLRLQNVTTNDSGNYTVVEGGVGAVKIGHAPLVVSELLAQPSVSVDPSPFLLESFSSVSLTCVTSSSRANVQWLFNGQPVMENPRLQLSFDNRTLALRAALRGDAGRYQCQAANLAGSALSEAASIKVVYGPDPPTIHPNGSFYAEHLDLELVCAASVFPSGRFLWFFNGRACGSGAELLLRDITVENAGTYTCQVENLLSLQKGNATVEIRLLQSLVRNVSISGPSEAVENQPLSLRCASEGTNVSYSWFRGGRAVGAGGRVSLEDGNRTLAFNPSSRDDAGDYSCLGSNGVSSGSSRAHRLDIVYGPDIPVVYQVIYIQRSKVQLSCQAESFPKANYVWFLNGKELPKKPATIERDFAPEDSGVYTCRAENGLSGQKSNTTLVVKMLGTRKDKE